MKTEVTNERSRRCHSESGRTIIEVLIVVAISGILTAIAIPQLISGRRLIRSAALSREIATQMRYAKQQAMSQRQACTFQYDDATKQIRIIDHNNNENANPACNVTGQAIMADAGYPNTPCSSTLMTIPLTGKIVLPANELSFGLPSGVSVTTLGDGTAPSTLVGGKLNVTFQPNGTIIDGQGNLTNRTLFIYNNKAAKETAAAISILGSSGRIKIWRFNNGTNTYAE